MEITLTKDQEDALDIAAVETKTTRLSIVQKVATDYADQMVYKYLIPVGERLASLKAENEALKAEIADLRSKLPVDPKGEPIVP